MKKQCPICKRLVDENLIKTCEDARLWILETIKKDHPEWVARDGSCPKCLAFYERLGQMTT